VLILILKRATIKTCLYFNAGTDSETALRDAFIMFDEDGKGKLHEE
jgi:hypothetical protein